VLAIMQLQSVRVLPSSAQMEVIRQIERPLSARNWHSGDVNESSKADILPLEYP
jgi:hypothetical protein